MDISTLAPAAIALLGPYLAKGAEEFAKAAGKVAAEKVGPLYQAIKKKFTKDGGDDAKQALARVEQAPDSPSRLAALESALAGVMELDGDFGAAVRELVQQAQAPERIGVELQGVTSKSGGLLIEEGHGGDVGIRVKDVEVDKDIVIGKGKGGVQPPKA